MTQAGALRALSARQPRCRTRARKAGSKKVPAALRNLTSKRLGTSVVPENLMARRQGTNEPHLESQTPHASGCRLPHILCECRKRTGLLLWRRRTFRRIDVRASDTPHGKHDQRFLSRPHHSLPGQRSRSFRERTSDRCICPCRACARHDGRGRRDGLARLTSHIRRRGEPIAELPVQTQRTRRSACPGSRRRGIRARWLRYP